MELLINQNGQLDLEWNYEAIKEEITEKVNMYSTIVYGDDQIKEAKADRAELNKFIKILEDKRKEIKKQCLAPYEAFEKQVKEIVAIIDKSVQAIDTQVKGYEEQKKQEKLQEIKAYAETKNLWKFTYEQIADPKWLNASVSMKAIHEELDTIESEIAADVKILEDLPEYSFEALEVYKNTRDMRSGICEANRLKEQADRKAEYEARKAAEIEEAVNSTPEPIEAQEEQAVEITEAVYEDDFTPNFDEMPNNRSWVVIKAYMTQEELDELGAYLTERSIEYTQIGG